MTAGPNTSCPFALDVKAEYYSGPPGTKTLDVHSSVTNQRYRMNCTSPPVTCTGGNGARVYFP